MRQEDIDPREFNAAIAESLDYVAVKLVELKVPATSAQITKFRADIEEFTMMAVEAAILPNTPEKWSWQMAARLISLEIAKQMISDVEARFGSRGSQGS